MAAYWVWAPAGPHRAARPDAAASRAADLMASPQWMTLSTMRYRRAAGREMRLKDGQPAFGGDFPGRTICEASKCWASGARAVRRGLAEPRAVSSALRPHVTAPPGPYLRP